MIDDRRPIIMTNRRHQSYCVILLLFWFLICVQGHTTSQSIHHNEAYSSSGYHIPVSLPLDKRDSFSDTYTAHLQSCHLSVQGGYGDTERILFRKQILLASNTRTRERVRPTEVYDTIPMDTTEEISIPPSSSQRYEKKKTLPLWIPRNNQKQYTDQASLDEESHQSPSTHYISSPLLPKSFLNQCNGMEFYHPDSRLALAQTGIYMAKQLFRAASSIVQRIPSSPKDSSEHPIQIVWKPDSKTKQLLQEQQDHPSSPILSGALQLQDSQGQVKEGNILVWVGQFQSTQQQQQGFLQDYLGAEFPIIRTTSIVPFSPRALAMLLLDSHRVKEYNKMSVGRTDEVIFQQGLDTGSVSPSSSSVKTHPWNHQKNSAQEANHSNHPASSFPSIAKIVRNLTQPPLSNKLLEFITFMYARPLQLEDDVGPGFTISHKRRSDVSSTKASDTTSLTPSSKPNASASSLGYIVVSRAVHGGRWNSNNNDNDADSQEGNREVKNNKDRQRSEILLSVNLLRTVPGHPHQTEMTTVSHVNVPSVPLMVATPIGIKGAIDFVKDLRTLGEIQESYE